MKSIKIFLVLLVCMSLIFVACTEEANYNAAGKPTNEQVFFPSSLLTTVNLSQSESSFEIELRRLDTTDALTVNLTVSQTDNTFSIPTTAIFQAGAESTIITITYEPSSLEYDNFKDISIAIAEDSYTTVYGTANYVFKAGVPAPWQSLGEAIYVDDFLTAFWGISQEPYKVEIQEHQLTPGLFRLINPYSPTVFPFGTNAGTGKYDDSENHHLEIDARDPEGVYIRRQDTGLDWTYGNFIVWSEASREMEENGKTLEEVKTEGYCGTFANGIITFPQSTLLCAMADYANGIFGTGNSNGWFKVVMPGVVEADYSIEIAYKGRYTDTKEVDHAIAYVTFGKNVSSAKVALISGRNITDALPQIIDGTIESVIITESGSVSIPCTDTGDYTFVAISYDAEEESQVVDYTSFKFTSSHDNAETWKSLGMASFTEDGLAQMYSRDPVILDAYDVEIQESEQNPGKFRLVNPYAEHPWNEEGDADTSKNYYMEINAMDPQGVYIELQDMGVNWGNGNFYLYSLAGRYLDNGESLEDIKAAGHCGAYINGIITFPTSSLLCTFEGDSSLYYANQNGGFKVVMPGVAASVATSYASTRAMHRSKVLKADPVKKREIQKVSFRDQSIR